MNKVSLRSIVWATALTVGLWLATLNPAQSCPFSKISGSQGTVGGNFPSLNWSGWNWKKIAPLSAGVLAGWLAATAIAYRSARVKQTAEPEAETATLAPSFPIPVYREGTDASEGQEIDELTSVS